MYRPKRFCSVVVGITLFWLGTISEDQCYRSKRSIKMPMANIHIPATVRPIAHTKEPSINSSDQVRIVVNQPKYAHHTITTKETAAKLTTQLRKKTKDSNSKLICSYCLRQLYESVWDLSIKCKRYLKREVKPNQPQPRRTTQDIRLQIRFTWYIISN
jgi:protoheme ferro-lyase